MDDKIEALLKEIRNQGNADNGTEKYIGVKEVADYFNVSVWAVYKMTQRNQIPYKRIRNKLRFKLSQIDSD